MDNDTVLNVQRLLTELRSVRFKYYLAGNKIDHGRKLTETKGAIISDTPFTINGIQFICDPWPTYWAGVL